MHAEDLKARQGNRLRTPVIATTAAAIVGAMMFYAGRTSSQEELLNAQGKIMAMLVKNHAGYNADLAIEFAGDERLLREQPGILMLLRLQLEAFEVEKRLLEGPPYKLDSIANSGLDGSVAEALAALPSKEKLREAMDVLRE